MAETRDIVTEHALRMKLQMVERRKETLNNLLRIVGNIRRLAEPLNPEEKEVYELAIREAQIIELQQKNRDLHLRYWQKLWLALRGRI